MWPRAAERGGLRVRCRDRTRSRTSTHPGYPKDSVSVPLPLDFTVVAAQAQPITGFVTEPGVFREWGIQSAQALPGG